jgi:D-alanine---D-serine ligase
VLVFEEGGPITVSVDIVFPVLHGRYGEDGTVQGLCELAGIPVVGSGSAASALCMDKDRAHKLIALEGIAVPKSICFDYKPNNEALLEAAKALKLPIFVKPVKAGSSIGVSMLDNYEDIHAAVEEAFNYDNAVIIEEAIEGKEVGCSVIGNHDLITGRANEIEVSHGFFNYKEKYTLESSAIHVPARIPNQKAEEIKEKAKIIYHALGCSGFARVDQFLTPDGKIVFNEVNTIPGFTPHSRYPNMLKAVGITFEQVVNTLLESAVRA